ncbi:homeodomain-interacting protein kinase 3-like isoform X2 [Perca fluviatilis]|uniref:homeodomain-interacting protein kinase 3-like isoform X2 n=1 Tax=Perca fluviatilis TaxID=8168 RepID=UPI0019628B39|nr:homeodomain-interacting protein kinase 3-like isoform X2 [Perca fluviatilis]
MFLFPDALQLPRQYEFLQDLGEGGFGKVVKCWNKDTKQTVAVKIPKFSDYDSKEVSILKTLMRLNLDQHNIVTFFGWFHTSFGRALVLETLDISIQDYILKTHHAPMRLRDVSTVIQQLARALDALKSIGVIHTDLKPDNIMLVDHRRRPFAVKLIDFGLAMPRSEARQGVTLQTLCFRSPEIVLGLPFSEAIDMWSLGCLMAKMVHGCLLFSGETEYEALQCIAELLGPLAERLLNNGQKTLWYFTRTESNSWRFKLRLERKNKSEAVEREQCIELLEAMLKLDETERITPREVLTHPFIAKGYHCSQTKKNWLKMITKSTNRGLSPASTRLPSGVIMVRPAAAEDTLQRDSDVGICLQTERNKTSTVKVTDSDSTTWMYDIKTQKRRRKKKKNGIFFSWMKNTFGSCCIFLFLA